MCGAAQSDSGEPSLGDLARLLRKGKAAPEHTVIDNDNLHQVMDEVQNRKLNGSLLFSIDAITKKFQVSSPDVTCDLSFSAAATSLLSDAYAPQDLPAGELAKLDGPATITRRHAASVRAQRHQLEHKGNYGRPYHSARPRRQHGPEWRCAPGAGSANHHDAFGKAS